MSSPFPHLFSPVKLRRKTLKNRIVFGAHTANMSYEGLPGDRHFGYYRERARGGAAVIVIEPPPAHRTAKLTRGNFPHYTGDEEDREFDTLVLATTNTPDDRLRKELDGSGLEIHALGDAVAARTGAMAFYEGRKLALTL